MDMQDKEFDELFRAKLDMFEAEPSANVWPGITDGLDAGKRRKSLTPWLSIAAGIVVLIGIGVFFIPKKTNTSEHPSVQTGVPEIAQSTVTVQSQPGPATQASPEKKHLIELKRDGEAARIQPNRPTNITSQKNVDTAGYPAKTVKSNEPQLIATVSQPITITKPIVPDVPLQTTVKISIDQTPGSNLIADKLASQNSADNKKDSVLVKRKHKIHNFGDLVNLVVDKLDKRPDKVVQFASDEDGDSHLTGINLGILKIKKGE